MPKFGMICWLLLWSLKSQAQMSTVELEVKPVPRPFLVDTVVDKWNKKQFGYANLSAQAKEILYWTNYSRINPKRFWDSVVAPMIEQFTELKGKESVSLQQDLYKTPSLPLFRLNETLIRTAQQHSDDIAVRQATPSHTATNGQTFQERMKMARIKACANENISLGSHNTLLSLVLLYLDIRLPEMGHRKALLNPNLTEIGIGYAIYGKDQFFMVQDMACSQN